MVACDVSQRVGILKKAQLRWLLVQVRWAQDVPPPTDPWKWGGAIGARKLSPVQVNALNPKTLNPRTLALNPKWPELSGSALCHFYGSAAF